MNIQIVKNLGLIALLGSLSLPVFAQPGPGGDAVPDGRGRASIDRRDPCRGGIGQVRRRVG